MNRCTWAEGSLLMEQYHDEEWGVPEHNDRKLFEYLVLEGMQCGLSWKLILERREVMRKCFKGFDYERMAVYGEKDIERILQTEGMIRSPQKVRAMIHNAQCFCRMRKKYGSFDSWLWSFSDGKTILYNKHDQGEVPASNGLSLRIARELKREGFKYMGPVVVYSFLQACGMINDHQADCECRQRIVSEYPVVYRRRYLEKK